MSAFRHNGSQNLFIAIGLQPNAVPDHSLALVKTIISRGYRAHIFSSTADRDGLEVDDRIQVHTWPSPRPTRFADALFLARKIRLYRPSCILANFGAVNLGTIVGSILRVPHRIAFYHTLSKQIDQDTVLSHSRMAFVRFRKRLVYRFATRCAVYSQAARTDLVKVFGVPVERVLLWRLGIADPSLQLAQCRASEQSNKLLVCVGRFNRSKGQDVFIRALPKIITQYPKIVVKFLGDGPLLDECTALTKHLGVESSCRFLGKVDHPTVLKELSKAWLSVVPSRAEAFGLVNIESMAVGTPVVGSRVDGIQDIVQDGIDGFLVPPDDPDALASRIFILMADPGLRERMSHNVRDRFLDRYEQTKVVEEQADWLEQHCLRPQP